MSETEKTDAGLQLSEIRNLERKQWITPKLTVVRVAQVTSGGTHFGNEGSLTPSYS